MASTKANMIGFIRIVELDNEHQRK